MIYYLYFSLMMSGYYAASTLLGSYMIRYAGARDMDLGFLFMIQPIAIFARPFICAQADRHQSHRQMLAFFAMLTSFAYIPFLVMPFIMQGQPVNELASSERARFWIMVLFHSIGSLGFCGVRSLGDALAVNFSKRLGTHYARYRKYGSLSYGICGYLIGRINEHWLLPDFVPGFLMYCGCMFSLGALVYSWPGEYFVMRASEFDSATGSSSSKQQFEAERAQLPTAGQTARHVLGQLCCMGALARAPENSAKKEALEAPEGAKKLPSELEASQQQEQARNLSISQQWSILVLLMRRDFRLALYLVAIFYNGLVAYSGPNFVFTYLDETCRRKGSCNGAELAGLVMICYCAVETFCYIIIDKFRGRLNRVLMLEITFISVLIHYYFYGFLLDSLSPYWFLVESLHGVEYSIGLSTSVELGYYFAREVELLLPELRARKIISHSDSEQRVKVALMATLSGCYTFMYDGIGCIVGCLVFGLTTGLYSFTTTWLLIGTLSALGFLGLLFTWLAGKCLRIRPQILRLRDEGAVFAAHGGGGGGGDNSKQIQGGAAAPPETSSC